MFSVDVTTEQNCNLYRETGHLARIYPKKLADHPQPETLSTRTFPELINIIRQHQSDLQKPPFSHPSQQAHAPQPTQDQQAQLQTIQHQQPTQEQKPPADQKDSKTNEFIFKMQQLKDSCAQSSTPKTSPARQIHSIDHNDSMCETMSNPDSDSMSISDFEDDAHLLKIITPENMKKLLTQ